MSRLSVKGNLTFNGLISAFGTLSIGCPDGGIDWPLTTIVAQKSKTTRNMQHERQCQPKALKGLSSARTKEGLIVAAALD